MAGDMPVRWPGVTVQHGTPLTSELARAPSASWEWGQSQGTASRCPVVRQSHEAPCACDRRGHSAKRTRMRAMRLQFTSGGVVSGVGRCQAAPPLAGALPRPTIGRKASLDSDARTSQRDGVQGNDDGGGRHEQSGDFWS